MEYYAEYWNQSVAYDHELGLETVSAYWFEHTYFESARHSFAHCLLNPVFGNCRILISFASTGTLPTSSSGLGRSTVCCLELVEKEELDSFNLSYSTKQAQLVPIAVQAAMSCGEAPTNSRYAVYSLDCLVAAQNPLKIGPRNLMAAAINPEQDMIVGWAWAQLKNQLAEA